MRSAPIEIPPDLISTLRSAHHAAVLTGAGTSAESGVPTFREAQTGLWARYDPEELATPRAFRQNPRRVWEWYAWRRELVSNARPNPGHYALAEMEDHLPQFTLITQNIDGLHQVAGSREVIELHGNIMRTRCNQNQHKFSSWPEGEQDPPRCPKCGSLLRPDVVWFGENLPQEALALAWNAARNSEVFFSIGTSSLVQPAASLPLLAKENGALLVEINPNETPLSAQAAYSLRGPSGLVLPQLVQKTWPNER